MPHNSFDSIHSLGEHVFVIASRESRLAIWQARHLQDKLQSIGLSSRILGMTTQGDQILDRSLSKVGGKGLFTKELENALASGEADLAIHSLKDVPMDLPDGFALACVMEREDATDAFVSTQHASFESLPHAAVVGTSSLRRSALLLAMRPDLRIVPLRGNLDTRLSKLDSGDYDAIVLATAGLLRLGLAARVRHSFSIEHMTPAASQGCLGIEIRSNRSDLADALSALSHEPSRLRALAERAVSRALGGSCSVPLAAHATLEGTRMALTAAWGDPEGKYPLLRASAHADVVSKEAAEELGLIVARDLIRQGAAA